MSFYLEWLHRHGDLNLVQLFFGHPVYTAATLCTLFFSIPNTQFKMNFIPDFTWVLTVYVDSVDNTVEENSWGSP